MRLLKTFSILFILVIITNKSKSQNDEFKKFENNRNYFQQTIVKKVDSILTKAVIDEIIPGAVILIAQHGKVLHKKAFGFAQVFRNDDLSLSSSSPMTTEHRFDLASLTKVFATTFGIMLLVDSHKIDLDAPVYTYLSTFRGPSKDSITVRDLLTHSAGLHPWKPLYYHANTSRATLKYISQLPLAYAVGKKRHYSDLGFMLLGYLIEEVSGQSLDRFLKNQLYDPLQLANTGFNPSKNDPPFASTSYGNPFEKHMVEDSEFGYLCDEDPDSFNGWRNYVLSGEVNDGNSFYANGGIAGHAGLFSTANDLKVLLDLLLNTGVYDGKCILSPEVIDTFLTKTSFGHGLGWAMSANAIPVDNLPLESFGHTGFTGTYAVAIPTFGLSIILLTNRQNVGLNESGHYNSVTPLRKYITECLIEAGDR